MPYTDDMMPSDDEDQDDAYMRRMKAEGKERDEEMMMDEDDEDESGMMTGNLWKNVRLAVQYAPELHGSILYFFFKPRSAYDNRSALTPERTDEPTYLLVLDEWT